MSATSDADGPRSSRFPSAAPPSVPPPPPEEPPPPEAPAEAKPSEKAPAAADGSRDAFEIQLARDILAAERFRASLLAFIPTIALFALIVVRAAYPEAIVALLHGNVDVAPAGLFLIAVATFELSVLAWTQRLIKRGQRASRRWRYGQAFVESSLPSAVVVYYAATDGPEPALLMPTVFLYFVFILLSTLRLDFFLSTFTGLVAAAEYALVAFAWRGNIDISNATHHGSKAAILLVSGIAAGFVAQRLRRSFTRAIQSVTERQRILGVFGQHVSPEVVDRLVAEKTTGESELRDVCVMFLDIRSFTSFTEKKSPAEVVDYLNTIFDATLDAVVKRRGIVNKFLGDGFMAVFGAPIDDANASGAAVDAALDMVARIEDLVTEGKIPPTRVGIGLHAGKAVVGNIGSADRKEYTVIGDVVNVASRIESLNKELGATILASEEVWSACSRSDIVAKQHDAIHIRGRAEPVRIWQIA